MLLRASGSTGRHPPPAHPGKVTPLQTPYLPLTLQPYTSLGAPKGLGSGRPDTPPRERLRGDRDPWAPNPVHPKKAYALCTDQRHVLPRLLPLIRHNTVIGLKVERNPLPYHVPREGAVYGGAAFAIKACHLDSQTTLRTSSLSSRPVPKRGGPGPIVLVVENVGLSACPTSSRVLPPSGCCRYNL